MCYKGWSEAQSEGEANDFNTFEHVWKGPKEGKEVHSQLDHLILSNAVEFGCLKVVNQMSYLTVGSLENTSRLVDVSLNWTINSTG